MPTHNLKRRLDRMEKQVGPELPPWIREIERRGPQNDFESMALVMQRAWKRPGLAPLLQLYADVGRETANG